MNIICIFLNTFVWLILLFSFKTLNVEKKEKNFYSIIILITILIGASGYYFSLHVRKVIYFWDSSNYYSIQLWTNKLTGFSLKQALKEILHSFWYDDYNCFICLFLLTPFQVFKVRTVNMYIALYYCVINIPVLVSIALVLIKCINIFGVVNKRRIFLLGYIGCAALPLIHKAALDGQPDIWGLLFCFLLIFYTMDYDFCELQLWRWTLFIILTGMLILTRRWYLFWIVGFWIGICFRVVLTNKCLLMKTKNFFIFGIIGGVIIGGCLYPLWKKILLNNYAMDYSFYNIGGLSYEFSSQIHYLGALISFILIILCFSGVINKKTRIHMLSVILCWGIAIALFTRIQNAGVHQSLIFLCCYIYIVFLGLCSREWKKSAFSVAFCLASLLNLMMAISENNFYGIFSDISLKPIERNDYEDIGIVYQFISKRVTSEKESLYIIPHGSRYNPDVFRNYVAPGTLTEYIVYGSAVSGVHSFPKSFCTAKYIITCDPLDDLDTSEKSIVKLLNESLIYLIQQGKFRLVKKFEFKNGTVFYCYERIVGVDNQEIDYLEEKFEHLSKIYPERWEKIMEGLRI